MANKLDVEVVCANLHTQEVVCLSVEAGTNASEAVQLSGLLLRYPHLQDAPIGVYGKVVKPETVLEAGDRVEIYRPLLIDPKENRRRRAAKNKDTQA